MAGVSWDTGGFGRPLGVCLVEAGFFAMRVEGLFVAFAFFEGFATGAFLVFAMERDLRGRGGPGSNKPPWDFVGTAGR